MRFLHLSAADHGGAGTAAARMHESLLALGHDSHLWVHEQRTTLPQVSCVGTEDQGFARQRFVQKAWLKLSAHPDRYFQNQRLGIRLDFEALLKRLPGPPDAIVVHFVSHFLGPDQIARLASLTGAPVIWSLLDMASLTGGCHYAWGCDGYTRQCGRCPALRFSGPNDASAKTWRAKSAALGQLHGVVVAGSSTLARQAAQSSLFARWPIETLLLGVSPERYPAAPRAPLRAEFGLPAQGPVVFFGATRFDQRRKGMHVLYDALRMLAERRSSGEPLPSLLAAGETDDFGGLRALGYTIHDLGRVDAQRLARCYATADVFACPSLEDSGPMMINEAMMCGTPVVAFDMGVAGDLIQDEVTGAIVKLGDAAAFARRLSEVLAWDAARCERARAACRATAIEKCTPSTQLSRFVAIAQRVVSGGYAHAA